MFYFLRISIKYVPGNFRMSIKHVPGNVHKIRSLYFKDVNQICAWQCSQNHIALYFEDVKQICTWKYIHTKSDCFIFLGYQSNMCLKALGCQSNMYQEVFTKSECFIFDNVNQICAWKFTQNHTALYFEDVKNMYLEMYTY